MNIDFDQLEFIDSRLRAIVRDLKETGIVLTTTSLYRIGDKGVHGQLPLRGVDFGVRDAVIGKALETYINDHWQYDPERLNLKCALYHGKPKHLHIQVHPNTKRL